MAYGFVIAAGDGSTRLDDGLHRLIAEVRVEQDMSRPTKFAVRFEEDLCDGDRQALSAGAIEPGETIAVLVPGKDDALVCLVKGQVTKLKSSAVTGGPGSWLEIHGEDLRAGLGRETVTAAWTGTATDIAKSVFELHSLHPDVKDCSTPEFGNGEGQRSHNQSGTDLQLLENLARMLGYEFWFEYSIDGHTGTGYSITSTPRFRPSPDYDTGGSGISVPAPSIDLLGSETVKSLRLDVPQNQCRTITSFRLDVDVEKATMALVGGHDDQTGEADSDEATSDRPPKDDAATRTLEQFHCTRTISTPDAGSAAEQASVNRSVITEEGWFITASASTSVNLLGDVIQSHEIVSVEGHGFAHSGRYHVSKVVHVVNAWGHLMDLTLRRNALPGGAHA